MNKHTNTTGTNTGKGSKSGKGGAKRATESKAPEQVATPTQVAPVAAEPVVESQSPQVEQAAAPAKAPRAKAPIETRPKATAERKSARRGTGMERLLLLLSQPEGTTVEEAMEYMGPLAGKAGPLPRGQVMGGIRWATEGLGYGVTSAIIPGRLVLCDHAGNRISYTQAPEKAAKAAPAEQPAPVAAEKA